MRGARQRVADVGVVVVLWASIATAVGGVVAANAGPASPDAPVGVMMMVAAALVGRGRWRLG